METPQQKSKLIFLDTETTGNEEHDHLCAIAFRCNALTVDEFFKPPLPISLEAMAVTGITNKMVADRIPFQGSNIHVVLKQIFDEGTILVAHNAEFDRKMLLKEGVNIKPEQVICTMKVARHLDVEDKVPNYKMQYLRYFYELEIEADAHNASDDILVLEAIFDKLNEKVSIEEMLKITQEPFLLRKLTFGKHKGIPFQAVPRDYMIWLRRQDKIEGDLLYTLNYYINQSGSQNMDLGD